MAYTNIDFPAEYFNTILYTGTGASNARTGVGFQPDWVWIKERSGVADHGLYDAVRGVQNQLESNTTTAETAEATGLTAFGTDGFTVGALAQLNTSGDTYVAWNWLANGAGVSNTAGTISSTVSANTDAGFSIVSYTGTGATGTVGHGLGAEPSLFILKDLDDTYDWRVYVKSLGNTGAMILNSTTAFVTDSSYYNNTTPSSTVFTLGNNAGTNGSGRDYIAYCFAEKKGYSKFGSFIGNGNDNGVFIYTGFKPAWFMYKKTNTTDNWYMLDNKRNTFNVANKWLDANTSDAEDTFTFFDFLSNGIKMRKDSANGSGDTYIYMAFAESPFVTSTSIPTTAR